MKTLKISLLGLLSILVLVLGLVVMTKGLFYIGFLVMIISILPAGYAIEILED